MPNQRVPRIGYVLKRFPRLSETFVINEILALERLGFEIEIFSLLKPPEEARHALLSELRAPVTYLPSGGNLGRIRMLRGLDARATTLAKMVDKNGGDFDPLFAAKSGADIAALHLKAAALAYLAGQRRIDHFHAHFGSDATTAALLAGRLSGIGYSYTAHARDIYHTYSTPDADNAMRREKLEQARFTVTVSDYNRKRLTHLAPRAAHRIHRLYNGIDLSRFRPAPAYRRPGLIVSIGRLIEKKGFADLIDACALMRDAGKPFRCRIIGDGPLRAELTSQIATLHLEDQIEMTGPVTQEQVIAMMREASVVTLACIVGQSGDRDGLPTVLLEAMALGLPVVTTTVSGGPEIVAFGETGLLVEPNDPAALAASIESLLEDEESAQRMGVAGRKRAERLFSLQQNAQTLAGYFERVAGVAARRLEAV